MVDIPEIKKSLLKEKARLEGELGSVGHKNPEIKGDWSPSAPDLNNPTADPADNADSIEEFEKNAALEVELEARLMEVDVALNKIEAGTYGKCRVCKAAIEDGRLKANPAAQTCIAHREG